MTNKDKQQMKNNDKQMRNNHKQMSNNNKWQTTSNEKQRQTTANDKQQQTTNNKQTIFWKHTIKADHLDTRTTLTTLTNWATLTILTNQWLIKKIIAEFALFTWSCFISIALFCHSFIILLSTLATVHSWYSFLTVFISCQIIPL